MRDPEGIGVFPRRGVTKRLPVAQVEAENNARGAELFDQSRQLTRPRERLETGDQLLSVGGDDRLRIFTVPETGVDDQL